VKEHIADETFWVTSWSHFCCWWNFVAKTMGIAAVGVGGSCC
jgi:hypothetical protein